MNVDSNNNNNEPLRSILDREGKITEAVPLTSFVVMVVIAMPIWAITVVPITICYQLVKAAHGSLFGSKGPKKESIKNSGYEVKQSIVSRKDRKYDIVLLGASGFTGKFAVRHLLKTYNKRYSSNTTFLKWAIAGRSRSKLEKTLRDVVKELENNNEAKNDDSSISIESILKSIDIIIVDTSDVTTLPGLVSNTRVVATTAGPFQLYGSYVVEFCAKFGTHYVDITGEVDWVRTMLVQWEKTAKSSGAKIVNFCGHDSIPWDLTVMKLADAIQSNNSEETLTEVRCWNELNAAASGGTFSTMLLAANGNMIQSPTDCDFDPFLRLKDGTKSPHGTKLDCPMFVSTSMKQPNETKPNTITAPFLMAAVNGAVVKRSTALRSYSGGSTTSLTYKEACVFPDYKSAFVNFMGMIMFGTAVLNPFTQWLLHTLGVIPKPGTIMKGVTLEQMENEFFLCVIAEGIGSKGTRMESIMYFDRDAGYIDTARMLMESAICLALQEEQNNGGFFSPSIAMGDTLLKRLCRTGTYYKIRSITK